MKRLLFRLILSVVALGMGVASSKAQLFDNLRVLGGTRYPVGDPLVTVTNLGGREVEGPKDIAVADLDNDGVSDFSASNKDGSVTLYFGAGDGTFSNALHLRTWTNVPADLRTLYFTNYYTNSYCDYQPVSFTLSCSTNITFPPPPNLPIPITNLFCVTNYEYGCVGMITNIHTNVWTVEGPAGLRGLALADFTGDGRRDIAVASPGEGIIYLFRNLGARTFSAPSLLPGWFGVRDLAVGDFDGDGRIDLAAAGTTNGLAQYRSLGNGVFEIVTNLTTLSSDPFDDDEDYDFPQPAYYLKSVRQPGDTKDELVVSFAQRRKIWILRAGDDGRLAIAGDIENVALTALDTGPLLHPSTNGAPLDLITAYSRAGSVNIFAATNLSQRFEGNALEQYYVPGGPRNVRIADLDQDGWNDVVIVAQNRDAVLTYRNNAGQLTLVAEAFAGRFPREMDLGDFNGDGHPDLAVLNRYSSDVSVFITSTNLNTPVGFLALDSVYPVDGGVSGLDLRDFNGDGRPDVLQLHRDSSEFSVRLTETNGQLRPPTYYAITNGFQPAAQIAVDVNGDGRADMVSANLSGSVTVRLGQPDGTFGPEQTFSLPADAGGSLFALVPADFNGDGKVDLAVGYFDCRVSFFKGDGTGSFAHIRTDMFIYEPRSMAAADCDGDGDLDLIGGAITGKFVVVENTGDLFTRPELVRHEFEGSGNFGSALQVVDQNNDGDPDLLFGSPGGFTLLLGGPGITFLNYPIDNGNNDPGLAGRTFVYADLDGDGDNDIASICSSNSCLTIQVFTNGNYLTALSVPVPLTLYLASGDLDGDGFADLVGSGDVLWVALSSRKATNAPPAERLDTRNLSGVVLNEVVASNTGLPLAADDDRTTDWVELFNGSTAPVSLNGWHLMLVRTNIFTVALTNFTGGSNQFGFITNSAVLTNVFNFPTDVALAARSHRLVICSDRIRTPYHSGFNLPAEGGLLCLFNAQSNEVSRVAFPAQPANIAYARYADGAQRFVANNIPSPGAPNVDNGSVEPDLTLNGVDLDSIRTPGAPLRFRATARDDVGIVNVSVLWRRLDIADDVTKRLILYDDGVSEDGPMNDGQFLGVLYDALPSGAAIQFYLECTDLTDQVVTSPGNPRFVAAGQSPQMHSLALGVRKPQLEISEIVADNTSGLTDERGGRPDWVEIRNYSSNAVSLAGVTLGPKFFGDGERMNFTNQTSIAPGEHLVIYADGNPGQGRLHAPFRLNRQGEQLVLTGTTAGGARFLIDALDYGPQPPDTALARLGRGGPWVPGAATPRIGNVDGMWRTLIRSNLIFLAFPTRAGRNYTVEFNDSLGANGWTALPPLRGMGLEHTVQQTMGGRRFFRVREE